MLGFLRRFTAVVALCAMAGFAQAQAIAQSGPVTSFHAAAWYSNGVQGDAGTPAAPFLSSLGLFNGANCPFSVSSQTGPGVSLSAYGQMEICQSATTTTFLIQGVNGQATPSVVFNIGGVSYPFPSAGSGNVTGPVSSVSGDAACWNNITGTLLKDCGALGTFAAQNFATPPAIGGTTPAAGAFTTLSATSTVSGAGITALMASPGPIGSTAAGTGAFTTLSATSTVGGAGFSAFLASPPTGIGSTSPSTGAFTTLSASSTVSGAGITALFASPPAIGGTASAAGAFTTLAASGTVSGTGFSTYLASPPAIGGTTAANVTATNANAQTTYKLGSGAGHLVTSATSPTISSGFGTSPSVAASNGTAAFTINVGTTNTGTGVLTMPAANAGWICQATDVTTTSANVFITKVVNTSATSVTFQNYTTAAATHAWTDSDILEVSCVAY